MNPSSGFPVFFTEVSRTLGRYEETQNDALSLAEHFQVSEYPRVLDICCGIGRMSGALNHLGYTVTGIDLSSEQLKIAQSENPGPTYIVGDMVSPPDGVFDIILNIYTSFGYYSTEEEDLSLLPIWRSRLRPGGVLIMELADMDRARSRIPTSGILDRHTGTVTEHLRLDWQSRLLVVDYISQEREWSCVTRLFEKEKLVSSLYNSGFSDVSIYGAFDMKCKEPDDNLVLVARTAF